MVYARTDRAAAALSRAITEGRMQKEYLAVATGTPDPEASLCDLLFYDRGRGKSFVVDRQRKGVKEARLDYQRIASRDGLSLLRVKLYTGRTHQIRVQLASRGFPLAGDRRYGAPASLYPLALCSVYLSFPHPTKKETLSFTYLPKTDPDSTAPSAFAVFSRELAEI